MKGKWWKTLLFFVIILIMASGISQSKEQGISVKEAFALADQYGKTDEQKYGNAVCISTEMTGAILNDLSVTFENIREEGGTSSTEKGVLVEEISKTRDKIKEVKTGLEGLKVPKVYVENHKNVMFVYDKLLESIDMVIDGLEKKDLDRIGDGIKKFEKCPDTMVEVGKDLFTKGYMPSEEFEKILDEKFADTDEKDK